MKKINEKISKLLDVDPIEDVVPKNELIVNEQPSSNLVVQKDNSNIVEEDSEFARDNIKLLIEKGNKAIDELMMVARNSQHPRAYEVIANMINTLANANKDLMELQKKKKDLSPSNYENKQGSINVDKAVVFTGTTTDLLTLFKQNKEKNGNDDKSDK